MHALTFGAFWTQPLSDGNTFIPMGECGVSDLTTSNNEEDFLQARTAVLVCDNVVDLLKQALPGADAQSCSSG